MEIINIADMVNPDSGKTYREENNELVHNIPLGSLVETDFNDEYLESPKSGLRLFVVSHDRDCDGTPLYSLSFQKDWTPEKYDFLSKFSRRLMVDSGYGENSLKLIKSA